MSFIPRRSIPSLHPLSRPSTRAFSTSRRALADHVRIIEVGPRDGLQNEKKSIPVATKIELIQRLAKTGLDTIEAGSFVSPKWVPQMAATDSILTSLLSTPPPSPVPITYQWLLPNSKGLSNLLSILSSHSPSSPSSFPPPSRHETSIFLSATETFSLKNTNCTISESLTRFAPLIASSKSHSLPVRAYISVALGCPFEGASVSPHRVAELAASLLEMGADEISIGDTTGMGTAPKTRKLLQTLKEAGVRNEDVAMHFHDTFGQALVNTMVSLEHGVRKFDSAVGGLGGCPYSPGATGNVATEDMVYFLESLGAETGVDLEEVSRIGEWITAEIGRGNGAAAGRATMARVKREEGARRERGESKI